MKITLDLEYDEAVALRLRLKCYPTGELAAAVADDICDVLTRAIQNEDERRGRR